MEYNDNIFISLYRNKQKIIQSDFHFMSTIVQDAKLSKR